MQAGPSSWPLFIFFIFPTPRPGKHPWAGLPCPAWPSLFRPGALFPFSVKNPAASPSFGINHLKIHFWSKCHNSKFYMFLYKFLTTSTSMHVFFFYEFVLIIVLLK
jgi:hypothetical protein